MKKLFLRYYRLSLWETILVLLILTGVNAVYLRHIEGWGPQTAIKELFPWGLCAGLDVFCGLALAVGGFAVAATLYVLRSESYRPILRASLLVGFLGFLMALLATVANRPFRLGALARLWGPGSIWLGAATACIVYVLLLILEFGPLVSQGSADVLDRPSVRFFTMLVAVLAAFLAALQQASMAKLLLITPQGFSPLWQTPMLPILLLLSSVCACLALVIFASRHTSVAFGRGVSSPVMLEMGKAMGIILAAYTGLRLVDLLDFQALPFLFRAHVYNYLLGVELGLFILPATLLIRNRNRMTPRMIYWCSVMIIAGFVANRLNTSITAREAAIGVFYTPQWRDFVIAYSILALVIALFGRAVRHLPVFPKLAASDLSFGGDPENHTPIEIAGTGRRLAS